MRKDIFSLSKTRRIEAQSDEIDILRNNNRKKNEKQAVNYIELVGKIHLKKIRNKKKLLLWLWKYQFGLVRFDSGSSKIEIEGTDKLANSCLTDPNGDGSYTIVRHVRKYFWLGEGWNEPDIL